MKTFVMLGLLLVLVMPTSALAQSSLSKGGSATMDAGIPEDGNTSAAAFGSPSSQSTDDAVGSSVLLAILLVQGLALAFVLWSVLDRSERHGSTRRRAFTCPFRGRAVIAEFQLDSAERPIDVVWCTAFRPAAAVECRKRCLKMLKYLLNPGSGEAGMPRIVRQPFQPLGGRRNDSRGRSSIRAPTTGDGKRWADP